MDNDAEMKRENNKRVVITGLGPISSIGIGTTEVWKNLIGRKTHVVLQEDRIDGKLWGSFYLHKVPNFDMTKFKIDKSVLHEIESWKEKKNEDKDLLYLLASVRLALDDSKLTYNPGNNRVGLFVSHENPGLEKFFTEILEESYSILNHVYKKPSTVSKDKYYQVIYNRCVKAEYDLQTFMPLFYIAKVFNLHGYSLFVNNACASGLYALEAASRQIRHGKSPAVVVAAGDHPVRLYKYLWFSKLGLYSNDGKIRPFAKDRNGFVFGDGATAIVLEDLEHAVKRGAKIYAEYLGGGFSLESWKITYPAITNNFYRDAILQAFSQSCVEKDEIDLINAHGVGTKITDRYEAKTINDVYGKNTPLVSAFKPYVGHNLGGSALLETAILLLVLQKNLIPPILNCQEIDPEISVNIVQKETKKNLNTVLKICCAFAGYNGASIFRKLN